MLRYKLRTLLIVLALAPPLLAWLPMAVASWLSPANRAFRQYKAAQGLLNAELRVMHKLQDEVGQLTPKRNAARRKQLEARSNDDKTIADSDYQKFNGLMQEKLSRLGTQFDVVQRAERRSANARMGLQQFRK